MKVKLIDRDERGRLRLSMKALVPKPEGMPEAGAACRRVARATAIVRASEKAAIAAAVRAAVGAAESARAASGGAVSIVAADARSVAPCCRMD